MEIQYETKFKRFLPSRREGLKQKMKKSFVLCMLKRAIGVLGQYYQKRLGVFAQQIASTGQRRFIVVP